MKTLNIFKNFWTFLSPYQKLLVTRPYQDFNYFFTMHPIFFTMHPTAQMSAS